MKGFKLFFQKKETYLGITVALAFQVIFFSVWLTAYDGVFDRMDQLKIAVVNDDQGYGEIITQMIQEEAHFNVTSVNDLNNAQKELDKREWSMIIHIPRTFTDNLEMEETTELVYYINQSNPTLSKQMMEKVAISITSEINGVVYINQQEKIAELIPQAIASESPNSVLAMKLAERIINDVQEASAVNSVKPTFIKTNEVKGFAATMIPLMIVLASFIGAMIMSQQLQFTANLLKSQLSKWSLLISRQVINILMALVLSVLTLGIMMLFNVYIEGNLFTAWLFQSLLFFSFLSLSQVFVILFGNPGMIFNIILTATQLVSAGAIVPREMLSSFYQKIGNVLPATYGTNGYFSLIYGGGDLAADFRNLFFITIFTLLIALSGVIFTKEAVRSNQSFKKGA